MEFGENVWKIVNVEGSLEYIWNYWICDLIVTIMERWENIWINYEYWWILRNYWCIAELFGDHKCFEILREYLDEFQLLKYIQQQLEYFWSFADKSEIISELFVNIF